MVYTVLVAKTYQVSDMSQTYPLMRGTAPLLVAVISVAFLGDALSPLAWTGIGVICLAILAMACNGRASSGYGITLALINAVLSPAIRCLMVPACGYRIRRWATRYGPFL